MKPALYLPESGPALQPSLGSGDPLPPGPYRVSMTWVGGRRGGHWSIPYTIVARNGQCVAGHIPSFEIATEIRRRLNRR